MNKKIHTSIFSNYLQNAIKKEKENKLIEAIEFYNNCIEINSEFYKAFYNIGLIYEKLKDYEKAITSYKKAISLSNEKNPIYLIVLSMLYFKMGEKKLGIEYLDKSKINQKLENLQNIKKSEIQFDKNAQEIEIEYSNVQTLIDYSNENIEDYFEKNEDILTISSTKINKPNKIISQRQENKILILNKNIQKKNELKNFILLKIQKIQTQINDIESNKEKNIDEKFQLEMKKAGIKVYLNKIKSIDLINKDYLKEKKEFEQYNNLFRLDKTILTENIKKDKDFEQKIEYSVNNIEYNQPIIIIPNFSYSKINRENSKNIFPNDDISYTEINKFKDIKDKDDCCEKENSENKIFMNIENREIENFLLKKENNEIEEYKKTLKNLFQMFFFKIENFRLNPVVGDEDSNFLFSFIVSKNSILKIIYDVYDFVDKKIKIKKKFEFISKIQKTFSTYPLKDCDKLIL